MTMQIAPPENRIKLENRYVRYDLTHVSTLAPRCQSYTGRAPLSPACFLAPVDYRIREKHFAELPQFTVDSCTTVQRFAIHVETAKMPFTPRNTG